MPSPIAHTTVAYVLWHTFASRPLPALGFSPRRVPVLLLAMAVLCMLPDLPSIYGLATGQLARFHNSWEHSLSVGVLAALLGAAIALRHSRRSALRWFLIVLLCYESHVLMDSLTIGRGVMLFWPFSEQRLASPIKIFYGLHWSDGWLSWKHLITLLTEAAFGGVVFWATQRWRGNWPRFEA